MMQRYVARFTPEVWINDYAVEADPYESEQEWDCTDYLRILSGRIPSIVSEVAYEISQHGDYLDREDNLRDDPAAPGWIRDRDGPFTIRVREAESGCKPLG